MAGEAHAAHHVDLEEPLPFRVLDLQKRLGIEDAEIIHENVGLRHPHREILNALGDSQVGGNAEDHGSRRFRFELADRIRDPAFVAAVDNDVGAGLGETFGDGVADAGGGAADDGLLAGKIDTHVSPPRFGFPLNGAAPSCQSRQSSRMVTGHTPK